LDLWNKKKKKKTKQNLFEKVNDEIRVGQFFFFLKIHFCLHFEKWFVVGICFVSWEVVEHFAM